MYALLVILGAVIAAAGVLIAVPGLPFEGRDFDASIITPGAVAVVGGLILIGLGLAVRVLSRIEKALATRALPHAVPQEIAVRAAAPAVEEPEPLPAPLPAVEPEVRPQAAAATVTIPRPLPEDAALDRLREQFPTLARLEGAPVVEETDVSLLPQPPARADEEVAEANGIESADAAAAKVEPRRELHVRPVGRPARRNFDAFWPKKAGAAARNGQAAPAIVRPAAAVQPAAVVLPFEPAMSAEPTQFQFREPEPPPVAVIAVAPEPVSVLKSGVVDGMAYTLYSDGSIEAQLPQGTLRFGSIAELRNHIEQSA
jgi:hypothetical protein